MKYLITVEVGSVLFKEVEANSVDEAELLVEEEPWTLENGWLHDPLLDFCELIDIEESVD